MTSSDKLNMFHVGAKEKETWDELQHCFQFSQYCLVLLNDHHHSYDEVIHALTHAMDSAGSKTIEDLTELVDKEGRAILTVGSYKVSQLLDRR